MSLLAGLVAICVAAAFTGAALYINVAEQPSRLRLTDEALLTEWVPSYERGTLMQSNLALVSGAAGFAAAYLTGEALWVAGAVLILANWPFTLVFIAPITRRLVEAEPSFAGAPERGLIERWGGLHAVRSALGAASTVAYACAIAVGGV